MHEHFLVPMFSFIWWFGIIGAFAFYFSLAKLGLYFRKKGTERLYKNVLFGVFAIREVLIHGYYIYAGVFSLKDSLPLHLCNISYIMSLICLFKFVPILYEFVLLLGMVGASMSFITPEMTHGYHPFLAFDYYLSHGLIIFMPMYYFFVDKIRPREGSWLKVFILGNIILGTVGLINYYLGSNYIFLCDPPKVDNPLVTGGFPYHIYGFEIIGSIFIGSLYYLFSRLKFNLLINK